MALATLPRRRQSLPAATGLLVLSCWPDIDYLPGVLLGDLNRFHQGLTHSLAFVLLGATLAYPLLHRAFHGKSRSTPLRLWAILLTVALSHLLFDIFTQDFRPPIGLPLFWPFSDLPIHSPFTLFPAWAKSTLAEALHSPQNLHALLIESLYALPLAFIPSFLRR